MCWSRDPAASVQQTMMFSAPPTKILACWSILNPQCLTVSQASAHWLICIPKDMCLCYCTTPWNGNMLCISLCAFLQKSVWLLWKFGLLTKMDLFGFEQELVAQHETAMKTGVIRKYALRHLIFISKPISRVIHQPLFNIPVKVYQNRH